MDQILVVSSVLLWVVVLVNLLLTLVVVRRLNRSESGPAQRIQELPVGMHAPDFTAETLSGEQVTLAQYIGRAVAFIFIAPHCGPCRDELPSYEALRPVAERAGVDLVLVSVADADETQALAKEFNIRLPVLVAPQETNSFQRDYKVPGTPRFCFVDSEGIVQSTGHPSEASPPWRAVIESWGSAKSRVPRLALSERR
jgi:peroxiredoxin